ncbi:MAG TPA: hypothetical protein DCQ12_03250, partial [Candidatus Cloacimonas sp.]|nr:hypothetical protein [Candidatus Cloacimonas sp.]
MPVVLLFIDHGSQGHEVVFISQCAAPDAFSAQGAVLDFASGKRDGPIVAVHHHGSIEDGAKSHGLDFPDLSYRRRSHGGVEFYGAHGVQFEHGAVSGASRGA